MDLGVTPAPDETTILSFRHLLEKRDLGGQMLDTVNEQGIRIQTGTIVDASIIHAPSSTKNEKKERSPEMHQTRKGNQSFFGLKTHIGVGNIERHAHSVAITAATVAHKHTLLDLGHSRELWGDGGYKGQTEAIQEAAPHAQNLTCKRTKFKNHVDESQRKNRTKSSGEGQGGASLPHPEAHLLLGRGALQRRRQESPSALRQLRTDQPAYALQTAGCARAVVRLQTGNEAQGPLTNPSESVYQLIQEPWRMRI